MSLAPAVSVTLGTLLYEEQVVEANVSLGLFPHINAARIELPATIEISAGTGDEAAISLDGGEGQMTVLTGSVHSFRRQFQRITVVLGDVGADLAQLRPSATYEGQSAADVIKALVSEVGGESGDVNVDLDLAAYVAHQRRTAAEHIAYLAELAGGYAAVDADGRLRSDALPALQADAALLYGRELLQYSAHEKSLPSAQAIWAGSGPAGSTSAPDALRQSSFALPEGAPTAGKDAVWQAAPVLRTPAAALSAAQGAAARGAAQATKLHAVCFMVPDLRPGMVLQIQELPHELSDGPWFLTRVKHRLRPDGGHTQLEAVRLVDAAAGLLGAALSAVGSLL